MPSEAADLRGHMDAVVRDTAKPLSLGFGLFILYTAITKRLEGEDPIINTADFIVAAYLLGLAAVLWFKPPALAWMNLLGATIAFALAGTDMTTQSVRGSVPSFPATAIVLAGVGALVLSWPWLIATQATVLAAWFATTRLFTDNPTGAEFIIQITTLTGLAIHWGRYRAYRQLIEARESQAAANAQLRAVNEELDRFAAVVAHDLKSPVAAIRLKAGTLRIRAPAEDEAQLKTLHELDKVADGMAGMIDDLLQYARAGTEATRHEAVDVQAVADQVKALFEERVRVEGGSLVAEGLPVIESDGTQIFQLLENLVGNALNYRRPDAEPIISITSNQVDGGIELSVHDNGQGFDPAMAETLFRPFERGGGGGAGHGLGLATCRRIAERHGGHITAESVPGHGSVFTVFLPQAYEEEEGRRD